MATAPTGYASPYAPMGGEHHQAHKLETGGDAPMNYASFMDRRVRHGFIRKVYGILSVQLLVTFAITFLFVLNNSVKEWVQTHRGVLYSAIALQLVLILSLVCVRGATRVVPYNYILLFAFTLVESYLVGAISSTYDTDVVLIAFGLTVGISIGLTIFAFQTKVDFTVFAGLLFSLLWSLIIFGFLMIFFRSRVLSVVYAWLGALIFSAYIVIDTQMIIGGKHKLKFTPDEYIAAALNIYLDIINLFLYILRIVGSKK